MTTVLGVRHGEVENPDGVIYAGLAGFGLSDVGRRQAAEVASELRGVRVRALYASPLDRAMETAEVVSAVVGVDVTPDERLHEWRHWQQWAGLSWEELREQAPDTFDAYLNDPGSVTSGESLAELADRMESWLSDAREAHPSGVVVAVSHLEPLRAILLRLMERPATDLFSIEIGTGQAVRIHPDPAPQTDRPATLLRAPGPR